MNLDRQKQNVIARRRRYVVHLSCLLEASGENRYVVRIRPSAARRMLKPQWCERAFEDDRGLIATINPLLPPGSDVRDVFGEIESPDGFFYLLWLSNEESRQLGWSG